MSDRVKESAAAFVRSVLPQMDYFGLYRGQVVAQSGDLATVDVQPDSPKLPGMSAVPLRLGLPGCAVQVAPGCGVLVGWDGGDPQRPYCALWDNGATDIALKLGSPTAVEAMVLGTTYITAEHAFLVQLFQVALALNRAAADPVLAALCSQTAANLLTAGSTLVSAYIAFDRNTAYLSNVVKTG